MKTASSILRQPFHRDDGDLLLTCADGSCLAELTLPGSSIIAEVEVVLQPRDGRGLRAVRRSPPASSCACSPSPATRRTGRFWMPAGISAETAKQCRQDRRRYDG
ncbi:MAG: hypothetical protein U0992_21745 [Planctomycetaceae bacterium]